MAFCYLGSGCLQNVIHLRRKSKLQRHAHAAARGLILSHVKRRLTMQSRQGRLTKCGPTLPWLSQGGPPRYVDLDPARCHHIPVFCFILLCDIVCGIFVQILRNCSCRHQLKCRSSPVCLCFLFQPASLHIWVLAGTISSLSFRSCESKLSIPSLGLECSKNYFILQPFV